jgi:transaldolase
MTPRQRSVTAQRLWDEVGRANLMVEIPATVAGLTAIP